jgi:hypothetical protein
MFMIVTTTVQLIVLIISNEQHVFINGSLLPEDDLVFHVMLVLKGIVLAEVTEIYINTVCSLT